MKKSFFVGLFVTILLSSIVLADMPRYITVQGRLTDASDAPLSVSCASFRFRIYDAPTLGGLKWFETINNVPIDTNGLFNVELGRISALSYIGFEQPYYLEIGVYTDPSCTAVGLPQILAPRVNITSSSYAFASGRLLPPILNNTYDIGDLTHRLRNLYLGGEFGSTTSGRIYNVFRIDSSEGNDMWLGLMNATREVGLYDYTYLPNGRAVWRYNGTRGKLDVEIDLNVSANLLVNGKVGIGIDSPVDKLDVNGTLRLRRIDTTEGGEMRWEGGSSYQDFIMDRYQDKLRIFNLAGTELMSVDNSGNVRAYDDFYGGSGSLIRTLGWLGGSPFDPGIYSDQLNVWMRFVTNNGAFAWFSDGGVGNGLGTTIIMQLSPGGDIRASGNISAHGLDPNSGYPSTWGGGVHTWDVAAEGSIAARQICLDTDGSANGWTGNDCRTSWSSVIANKGLQKDASNNFGLINCNDQEILKYNLGTGQWVCTADQTGGGGGGAGWAASANYVYNDTPGIKVGIGTNIPAAGLYVNNTPTTLNAMTGIYSWTNRTTGSSYAIQGYSVGKASWNYGFWGGSSGATASNYGIYGYASGDTGTKYALYGRAIGLGTNWGLYVESGNAYINDNVGIGTTGSPLAKLHVDDLTKPVIMAQGPYGAEMSGAGGGRGIFGSNLYVDASNNLKTAGTHLSYGYSGMEASWGNLKFYTQVGSTTGDAIVTPTPRMTIDTNGNTYINGDLTVTGLINGGLGGGTGALIANFLKKSAIDSHARYVFCMEKISIIDLGHDTDPNQAYKPCGGTIKDNYVASIYGYIYAPIAATYTFWLTADDGGILSIDGGLPITPIPGNWHGLGGGPPAVLSGTKPLTQGWHPILIQHFQDVSIERLKLEWSYTGQARQVVPSSNFAYPPTFGFGGVSGIMPGDD